MQHKTTTISKQKPSVALYIMTSFISYFKPTLTPLLVGEALKRFPAVTTDVFIG